jgi:hypothetical protein
MAYRLLKDSQDCNLVVHAKKFVALHIANNRWIAWRKINC